MRSIRFKLVLAMTLVVVVIMSVTAFVLKSERENELNKDLFLNLYTFAENTAGGVVSDYEKLVTEDKEELLKLLAEFVNGQPDVGYVQVASVKGGVVLSSDEDAVEPDLRQIQVATPSVRTEDGRVLLVSFEPGDDGVELISYYDLDGGVADPLGENERISYVTFPVGENYSVVYGADYNSIDMSIAEMSRRILLMALLGILFGVIISQVLSTRLVSPIMVLRDGAKKIAKGDFDARVKVKNKDEIGVLAKTFNRMALDLKKSTEAIRYRERVQRELELAAKIQEDLLPDELPKIKGLDVAAEILPADEVGGDCYDFISLEDGNWITYLGDVTGHGLPSSLVSSIANAILYSYSTENDLKSILVKVNKVLKVKTGANVFLTLLLLKWDENSKVMEYMSAGHEPLFYWKSKSKEVVQLDPGGVALGMFGDIGDRLKLERLNMKKGDFIVTYSDGIIEARNNKGKLFGMEGLKGAIEKAGSLDSAADIHCSIIADLKKYIGANKQLDDISLIILRRD